MPDTLISAAPVLFMPEKQPAKPLTKRLKVVSDYQPAGDQPAAIADLVRGIDNEERDQVLLGVTGSGKTFTMAKVIEALGTEAGLRGWNTAQARGTGKVGTEWHLDYGHGVSFAWKVESATPSAVTWLCTKGPGDAVGV